MGNTALITKEKEMELRDGSDNQDPRLRRTPEKTREWSDAAEKAEHLLIGISSELSISRVADNFQPKVMHHLRTIQSRINQIKQEIRRIEIRVREIEAIEREWWKERL